MKTRRNEKCEGRNDNKSDDSGDSRSSLGIEDLSDECGWLPFKMNYWNVWKWGIQGAPAMCNVSYKLIIGPGVIYNVFKRVKIHPHNIIRKQVEEIENQNATEVLNGHEFHA